MVQKVFRCELSGESLATTSFIGFYRDRKISTVGTVPTNVQGDEYDGAQARAQVGAPSKVGTSKPGGVTAPKTTTRKPTATKPSSSTTSATRPAASRSAASGGAGDSSQYKRQVEELNEKLITMEQSLESLERV